MKHKWSLFWLILVFCILGSLALIYIAYTSVPSSNSSQFIEVTKTLFLCLGGIGVILPVYLNTTNAIETRYDNKIENTFKLLQKWDDPQFLEARKLTRELKAIKPTISDNELIERILNNQELKQSVVLLFNYFDQVRVSFLTNRIERQLFVKSLGIIITDIINRFEPYVKTISSEAGIKDIDQLKTLLNIVDC